MKTKNEPEVREILGEPGAVIDDNGAVYIAPELEFTGEETLEPSEPPKENETKLKLSELTGDRMFDFIAAAKPLIETVMSSKLIKLRFFPDSEKEVIKAAKTKQRGKDIDEIQENMVYNAVKNDILLLLDLADKKTRTAIFELIAILDEVSADDVKQYNSLILFGKIGSVLNDEGFKNLFTMAAKSVLTAL